MSRWSQDGPLGTDDGHWSVRVFSDHVFVVVDSVNVEPGQQQHLRDFARALDRALDRAARSLDIIALDAEPKERDGKKGLVG